MAYVQPILGAYTLPHPTGYSEKHGFRGAVAEMADGSVQFDVVNDSIKKVYSLTWVLLTDAQKSTLESAFGALKLSSAFFTPPSGASMTSVTRVGPLDGVFTAASTAEGMRWNCSIELREV